MEDVQRTDGLLLDSRGNRSCSWSQRLGNTQRLGEALHQDGPRLLRCFRWNCLGKSCTEIYHWSVSTRSSLFLRIPNDDGEHSQRDILSFDWHLHIRSRREKLPFQSHRDCTFCHAKGSMGLEMDRRQVILRWEACSLCMRRRNLLQWIFLCHLLAQEKRSHAWTYFFKRVDLQRWRNAYRFCMPFVQTLE